MRWKTRETVYTSFENYIIFLQKLYFPFKKWFCEAPLFNALSWEVGISSYYEKITLNLENEDFFSFLKKKLVFGKKNDFWEKLLDAL